MQGHRQNQSYALKAVIRSQNPVQIFSEDARERLVHPWQQDAGTAALWGRFGGGSRVPRAAALPHPAQQPLLQHRGAASEIERGLAAEIREPALLRRGEHDLVPMGISFLWEGPLCSRTLILLLLPLAELHGVLWGVAG